MNLGEYKVVCNKGYIKKKKKKKKKKKTVQFQIGSDNLALLNQRLEICFVISLSTCH